MKTEEEIKELLEIYKNIQFKANVFSYEFTLANGAITALKQILGD